MSDWVVTLIDKTGYIGVGFLMFLETVFPPIPSEVIMPVAGVAAAQGSMTLGGVIASGTAGAMFGNVFWYLVARVIGLERFRPFIEKHGRWLTLDWYDVEKSEKLFGRFGSVVVGVGRLLPTVRSVVSIPAGLLKMRLRSFLIWSTIGTAGWSSALAVAGYVLGKQFDDINKILGPLSSAIIALIVLAYVWRQLTWRKRHPDA
ncbi:DedA family protein [Sphingosinicella sp. BN140058]|uniref:DedA family protein n=1 Tax=Sphingosinicella sp. BN140058 TaxID=1892855 RepID=UPI00101358C3|nr:DedA family protein [Sphingosinicella sp. BN140058]QAY75507.1 DedA family protein [Sphingosinicella sp. BN140058]